jgi:hypothetical protein
MTESASGKVHMSVVVCGHVDSGCVVDRNEKPPHLFRLFSSFIPAALAGLKKYGFLFIKFKSNIFIFFGDIVSPLPPVT